MLPHAQDEIIRYEKLLTVSILKDDYPQIAVLNRLISEMVRYRDLLMVAILKDDYPQIAVLNRLIGITTNRSTVNKNPRTNNSIYYAALTAGLIAQLTPASS
jgi:hypothetical protein